MNILLWILQALLALMYFASGAMKVFTLEKVAADYKSVRETPRAFWTASGLLEMACSVGLVVPRLTPVCAALLSVEALVLCANHVRWREKVPMISTLVFAALTAFIAWRRFAP